MAHVIRGNFDRHSRYSQPHSSPGGWWKFGLVAATATFAGILFLNSSFVRGSEDPSVAPFDAYFTTVPVQQTALDSKTPAPLSGQTEQFELQPAPLTSQTLPPPTITSQPAASQAPASVVPPVAAQTSSNIRGLDLAAQPALVSLAQRLHGSVDVAGAQFADLTGDGAEEVIVPITSGGTQGDLAFVVLTLQQGMPVAILTEVASAERQGLVMSLDGSQLTESSAVYGPNDANCCPIKLERTYYRWNGSALVPDKTTAITIPQEKDAD